MLERTAVRRWGSRDLIARSSSEIKELWAMFYDRYEGRRRTGGRFISWQRIKNH
jgi:hypothetical protein